MINRIKNRLLLTNTFVLMVILLLMAFFIYNFFSYTYSNNKNEDLITLCYQSKRFLETDFREKKGDYSYNQELDFFRERLRDSSSRITVLDSDFNITYSYGKLKVSKKKLKKVARAFFADSSSSDVEVIETDGRYVITDSTYRNISFRSCITVMGNEDGSMTVLMISNNSREARNTLSMLLSILALTIILGVGLSLVGGYFTTERALVPIRKNMDNQKQFIADASHELRTPIAVIKTNLDLIESNEEETVKSQETWINYAKSEASRMDKIVGDLLFLSKADLDEIPFMNSENDIVHITMDTIEKMHPIAGRKNIGVYLSCAPSRVMALVDPERYAQLLMILIDNAVKYSEEDTKILVSIRPGDSGYVIISVRDNGSGIPEEDLDRIFERFYRVDKARSRKEKGTGLGLPIAAWIAENLGGKLTVESTLGEGSTFTITLPCTSIEENDN